MPELLRDALAAGPSVSPAEVLARLAAAFGLGLLVALVYRWSRREADVVPSFPTTLVLLAILIAMVTQVIGDNVARAFSLVGALSIVRFRTVVRDTQDTAYVIFSVGVGMAVGAGQLAVAVAGLGVVAVAAGLLRPRDRTAAEASPPAWFELQVRLGIGHDPETLVAPTVDRHARHRQLMGMATARQGAAMDATYRIALPDAPTAETLVRELNRLDGVQGITLTRVRADEESAPWRIA